MTDVQERVMGCMGFPYEIKGMNQIAHPVSPFILPPRYQLSTLAYTCPGNPIDPGEMTLRLLLMMIIGSRAPIFIYWCVLHRMSRYETWAQYVTW